MAEQSREDGSLRHLTEQQNLALGITTGAVEQVITQPLLYWKNSFQQGLAFTVDPRLLYRGTLVAVVSMASLTGIQFGSSGFVQKAVVGDASARMTWGQEVCCALLGGALSGPVCCALELTMIQQQRFGGSLAATWARILRERGPTGFLRGISCSTGREAFYTAGYLGTVPATQAYFRDHLQLSPHLGNAVGAIGGGLVCAAASQPLDTAKTCMQGDLRRETYGGTWATLKLLRRKHGSVTAFYRGYCWRSLLVIVDFVLLDALAKVIRPIMYPS